MEVLTRSKDRKVANSVTKSGIPNIKNAFGLPAGVSCPGMTEFCGKICYAKKLERIPTMKSLRTIVARNMALLENATIPEMADLLDRMILEFVADCERKNAPKKFRIHWDGDFFSIDYASAWAIVMRSHPDVEFWAYTRSFIGDYNVVPVLYNVPNLALYLSADSYNIKDARLVAEQYDLNIAMVSDTFAEAKDALPDSYRCPENLGSLPLITEKGSACIRCGVCPDNRGNVLFSVSKS